MRKKINGKYFSIAIFLEEWLHCALTDISQFLKILLLLIHLRQFNMYYSYLRFTIEKIKLIMKTIN